MKKAIAICSAAVLLAASAATITACDKTEESKRVMNISFNPSVEFVLDSKDKVVSVNALNEEGNLIVSAEAFTGKTAGEAAKLFVQVSKETGFLVEANASVAGEEIGISLSGDSKAATKLYNDVNAEISKYLSAENIGATVVQAEAISRAHLEALVAECAPYVEVAKIEALEYAELVETLYESRKETAKYYSQELKNAYYEAKAFVMEQAELEVVKSQLNVVEKAAVEIVVSTYNETIALIENTRKTVLIDENSIYQVALKAFREAKVNYLKYRQEVAAMEQNEITTAVAQRLAELNELVYAAETALLSAGSDANAQLNNYKRIAADTYTAIMTRIGDYSAKVNAHLTEIGEKQQTAKAEFFTAFERDYAAAVTAAQNNWAAMKAQLSAPQAQ